MNQWWKTLGLQGQIGVGVLVVLAASIFVLVLIGGLLTSNAHWLVATTLVVAFNLFPILWIVRNKVVGPVNRLASLASDLARDGDLNKARAAMDRLTLNHELAGQGNEVHELLIGLNELLSSQESLAGQAHAIAADDLWNACFDDQDLRGDLAEAFGQMIHMLRELSVRVNRIAQGDMSTPDDPGNRMGNLGSAFYGMNEKLKLLFDQLKTANTKIDSSSQHLQTASRDQAASATEQAAAITETMATMEELAASSGHIADIAKNVVNHAEEALGSAEIGNQAVYDVGTGMDDIVVATQMGAQRLLELGEKSRSIGKVADLITGIAEQSKFLALNAAIEAARAGEAGRGFAVVAEEVRNLANHVVESTANIEGLIAEIQTEINAAVLASEEGVKRAEHGRELAQRAQDSLVSITGITKRSTDAARQIELATNQQRSASTQVAATVREVAGASEEVASGAKKVTELSTELSALAQNLKGVLETFDADEPEGAKG